LAHRQCTSSARLARPRAVFEAAHQDNRYQRTCLPALSSRKVTGPSFTSDTCSSMGGIESHVLAGSRRTAGRPFELRSLNQIPGRHAASCIWLWISSPGGTHSTGSHPPALGRQDGWRLTRHPSCLLTLLISAISKQVNRRQPPACIMAPNTHSVLNPIL